MQCNQDRGFRSFYFCIYTLFDTPNSYTQTQKIKNDFFIENREVFVV